ncbi:MAG: diaminopimelate epimerase [Actinomycetota bacterium]
MREPSKEPSREPAPTPVAFEKYQGTGNDFVMVLDLDDARPLTPQEVSSVCDRRTGVGADGVIRVVRADGQGGSFLMDYTNADGSLAEMCGNGIRCVGVLLHDRHLVAGDEVDVLTRAGTKRLILHPEEDGAVRRVTVSMGIPNFTRSAVPMRGPAWETFLARPFDVAEGLTLTASAVSIGNPHLVLFLEQDPANVHVGHVGPAIERHELFPEHTNVEFAFVRPDGEIDARVWERGVGETMACGSGACAVAVAANEAGLAPRRSVVRFPGGSLEVTRRDDGEVLLTGDAARVFEGSIDLEALSIS